MARFFGAFIPLLSVGFLMVYLSSVLIEPQSAAQASRRPSLEEIVAGMKNHDQAIMVLAAAVNQLIEKEKLRDKASGRKVQGAIGKRETHGDLPHESSGAK